jgi:endonuclease/exonuclease/phosphatase family metal-dependent hydrolase
MTEGSSGFRLALAFAAALGASACAETPKPEAQGLKLATWNLEHLAEADGQGCRPRTEADYAKLRAYAEMLDADVIALQEVESAAAAARVFDPAKYEIVMSGQPYPPPSGTCGGDSAQTFRPQRTGFAIRKGIAFKVNAPLEALDVGREGRPLRWGVDVTLEGKQPLRLLGVHLKSGCSAGNAPSDDDCPPLMAQVPIVEGWIDARESAGEAFAILGDFNRRLKPADAEVWQTWDDGDPKGLDLHIAALEAEGGPRSPGCDGGRYPDFIDHVVLSDRAFKRWDTASFAELVYAERGDAMPSDHCPVAVTVSAD